MKLTTGVNLINILWAAFLFKRCFDASFLCLQFVFVNFGDRISMQMLFLKCWWNWLEICFLSILGSVWDLSGVEKGSISSTLNARVFRMNVISAAFFANIRTWRTSVHMYKKAAKMTFVRKLRAYIVDEIDGRKEALYASFSCPSKNLFLSQQSHFKCHLLILFVFSAFIDSIESDWIGTD